MSELPSTPDSTDEGIIVSPTNSNNEEDDISPSIDDYVTTKPISIQRESTRSQISLWLLIVFSCSVFASYVMVGMAAFLPNIDRRIITDSLPLLLTPQITLLGVALGFYFGEKK
jgi:hypothetical protein